MPLSGSPATGPAGADYEARRRAPPARITRRTPSLDRVELLCDFVQLARQRVDTLDLVRGRSSLPVVQGAVDRVEVLADALLARDGTALFRGDDLALDGVELLRRR